MLVEGLPQTKVIIPFFIIVGRSRAAGTAQEFNAEDPNKMMLLETGKAAGVQVMSKNINKERDFEKILIKLRKEFTEIDLNKDGSISLDEIIKFLNSKTNGTVDTRIAE